jgi:type VI secretion system protein ImpG
MRDELLHYYERELGFMRKLAGEFAQRHPEVAGRLQLGPQQCPDPHVERLIESFALLAGRIQLRLDDDFSELCDALLGIVYPHYVAPLPAVAIARLELAEGAAVPPQGLVLPRHTALYTKPVDGVRCRFRTAYPLELWPIAVESAEFEVASPAALGCALPPEARSALRIRLRTQGGARFDDLAIRRLCFFFEGAPAVAHRLHELFLREPRGLVQQAAAGCPGRLLGPEAIRPLGFTRDEGLLEYPEESFLGYRVLQEYFAYPEKFLFVELGGLQPATGEQLELCLLLGESLAELEPRVRPENLALGCTPAVNLFEMSADPIRVSHTAVEYPVLPDARHPGAYEVCAIRGAQSTERESGRVTAYAPLYSARHGAAGGAGGHWYAARRSSLRADDRGSDVFLSLVDASCSPLAPAAEVLSVQLLCTNRDLPARLAFGDPRGDFEVPGVPGIGRACVLRGPSEARRAPIGPGSRWRVVSHLALNHLSLCDERPLAPRAAGEAPALDALREILKLYDFVDSPVTRQRIGGLLGLSTRRVVRRLGGAGGGFARGTEIELLFDPEQYAGSSVFLFAAVLEVFLGLYAALNSFTQVAARSGLRAGVLKRWPARAGETALL